jgi:hypothetical protein
LLCFFSKTAISNERFIAGTHLTVGREPKAMLG